MKHGRQCMAEHKSRARAPQSTDKEHCTPSMVQLNPWTPHNFLTVRGQCVYVTDDGAGFSPRFSSRSGVLPMVNVQWVSLDLMGNECLLVIKPESALYTSNISYEYTLEMCLER